MVSYRLEQVFLRPSGNGTEVLLVLLSVGGAPRRERRYVQDRDLGRVVGQLGRHLAERGNVDLSQQPRLRAERNGSLKDDPKLRGKLVEAFRKSRAEEGW